MKPYEIGSIPVLHRPELQPGVRVAVAWPNKRCVYTVYSRDVDSMYLRHDQGDALFYVLATGVFDPVSGAEVIVDVLHDDPRIHVTSPTPVFGRAIVGGPKALSLRALYCVCMVPSETPNGTVDDLEPHEHSPDCPVAPVPDVHGGMRASPVPAGRVLRWKDAGCGEWLGEVSSGSAIIVDFPEHRGSRCLRDLALVAFYLPPAQPDAEPVRLPVDDDPELEGVAARATHEPGRWKAGTR